MGCILTDADKNIERHTAHTIVSWPNPKQWLIVHTSDLMMIIIQIMYILPIITKEMGKLKTHSPTYCIMDNWENMLNLTHIFDKYISDDNLNRRMTDTYFRSLPDFSERSEYTSICKVPSWLCSGCHHIAPNHRCDGIFTYRKRLCKIRTIMVVGKDNIQFEILTNLNYFHTE